MGTISKWFDRIFTTITKNSNNKGYNAEQIAKNYLIKKGLKLVSANYESKVGEIDLIMLDKSQLVFIEVRFRQSSDWASPAESVTKSKQRKIINAAKYYLLNNDSRGELACRFDVVAMTGEIGDPEIEWIKHAFY